MKRFCLLAIACCMAALPALAAEECCPAVKSLFGGQDLKGWTNARPGQTINWVVEDGAMTNTPKDKDIATTEQFKDFDLKLEYKTVAKGNSGVYLRGRIELQVLDSFGKTDISTGDDGGIYGQHAPLVNASKADRRVEHPGSHDRRRRPHREAQRQADPRQGEDHRSNRRRAARRRNGSRPAHASRRPRQSLVPQHPNQANQRNSRLRGEEVAQASRLQRKERRWIHPPPLVFLPTAYSLAAYFPILSRRSFNSRQLVTMMPSSWIVFLSSGDIIASVSASRLPPELEMCWNTSDGRVQCTMK